MPRDPNIPDAFEVYTLVLLRRPPNAPQMPLGEQSDISMRGPSICACGLEEAARLSDGDPSVAAGRLAYDLMEWWVGAGSIAFPRAQRPVGDRRVMPEE
jgi:hypothetical protein